MSFVAVAPPPLAARRDPAHVSPEITNVDNETRKVEIVAMTNTVHETLSDPVAQALLQSTIPARLAYTWHDGTPRVVPIWFHWNGEEVVCASPPDAPKVEAIEANAQVAITIDDVVWPYKVLLIRGTANVDHVDGIAPEYAAAAERYFGEEQGRAWCAQVDAMMPNCARIRVRPEWAAIIDFETRFPSKIASRMG
jgi:hypothetical protein